MEKDILCSNIWSACKVAHTSKTHFTKMQNLLNCKTKHAVSNNIIHVTYMSVQRLTIEFVIRTHNIMPIYNGYMVIHLYIILSYNIIYCIYSCALQWLQWILCRVFVVFKWNTTDHQWYVTVFAKNAIRGQSEIFVRHEFPDCRQSICGRRPVTNDESRRNVRARRRPMGRNGRSRKRVEIKSARSRFKFVELSRTRRMKP